MREDGTRKRKEKKSCRGRDSAGLGSRSSLLSSSRLVVDDDGGWCCRLRRTELLQLASLFVSYGVRSRLRWVGLVGFGHWGEGMGEGKAREGKGRVVGEWVKDNGRGFECAVR